MVQSPEGSEWHQGQETFHNAEDDSMQPSQFDQIDLQTILGMVQNGPNDSDMDILTATAAVTNN